MRWLISALILGALLWPSIGLAGNDYPGGGALSLPPAGSCRDVRQSLAACLTLAETILAGPEGAEAEFGPAIQYAAGIGNSALNRPASLLGAPPGPTVSPAQLYVSGSQPQGQAILAGAPILTPVTASSSLFAPLPTATRVP